MDLKKVINRPDATFVDVRESFEFFFGHVKGAVNIPLSDLAQRLDELRKMRKPIVLYCRSGNRSGQALAFLKANGFTDVYNGGSMQEVKSLLPKAA